MLYIYYILYIQYILYLFQIHVLRYICYICYILYLWYLFSLFHNQLLIYNILLIYVIYFILEYGRSFIIHISYISYVSTAYKDYIFIYHIYIYSYRYLKAGILYILYMNIIHNPCLHVLIFLIFSFHYCFILYYSFSKYWLCLMTIKYYITYIFII